MGPSQPYRLLLEVLRPAVWTVDAAGIVTDASPGTEELTEWPRAQVVGRPWADVAAALKLSCTARLSFSLPPSRWSPVLREPSELTTPSGAVRPVGVTVHHLRGRTHHGALVLMEELALAPDAQAALAASEQRYAALFDTLTAAILVLDTQGRIVDSNPTAAQMFAYARDELLGRPISDLVTWESLRSLSALEGLDVPEEGLTLELECRRGGDETLPVEVHMRSALLGDERLVVAHIRDISEIRRTRLELAQAQRFSQRILEATDHLVHIYDARKEQVVYVSPGALRHLGYGDEELADLGPDILAALTHPDDRERCAAHRATCEHLADGEFAEMTFRVRAADGQWRLFLSRDCVFQRAPDGAVALLLGTGEDVTDRLQAEASLRVSRETAWTLLNATTASAVLLDSEGVVLGVNDAMVRQLGLPAEQLVGTPLVSHLPEEGARLTTDRIKDTIASGEARYYEDDYKGLHFSSAFYPIVGTDGEVTRLAIYMRDDTERVRADAALRLSNDTAWALLNATHDIAALVDTSGSILGINEAAARLLQRPVSELVGTRLGRWLGSRLFRLYQERLEATIAAAEPQRFEDEFRGRIYSNVWYPVTGGEGRVTRIAVFIRDATEARQEEAQQRLATVGQLAAGLAHEFNNILMGLMLAAETAATHQSLEEYEHLAELVLRASQRGGDICQNLLTFARPREPLRQTLRIEEAIEGALGLTGRQLQTSSVTVVRDYQASGIRLMADPAQIEQVFLNLILNACHAMPEGGRLTIRTRFEPGEKDGGTLVAEVEDTGIGIPAAHIHRVFEPFFTTKGRLGQSDVPGTGLGLSVSHGIVSSHGGVITVRSEVGVGSTFTLRLPAVRASETTPVAPRPAPAGETPAGLRVLLAEDDADVRQVLAAMLASGGHQVTAVGTPTEAIAQLQAESYDLVVTDLLMPEGGGRALLDWLKQQADAPPVLIASGHEYPGLSATQAGPLRVQTLPKPFRRDALLEAIAQLLDR
ncbi:MAG: PAS domain S-box protein [Armatimonadetes bacterium]|nr:PAS domain S-box protein [Armatimonadota bacterium]